VKSSASVQTVVTYSNFGGVHAVSEIQEVLLEWNKLFSNL